MTFPTLGGGKDTIEYINTYKYVSILHIYIYIYNTHTYICINVLLFSHPVISDSLKPYGLQHARTKRYKYRKIQKQLLEGTDE